VEAIKEHQDLILEPVARSLWADYLEERLGRTTLEFEHGLIMYSFTDTHCYIIDIYVKPEHRQKYYASAMADHVSKIAKDAGYTKLLGTVQPTANGSTNSMKALFGYGFKLLSCDSQAIYLEKGI
jgi:ribosomal protein S18 acetylase RimI-like enzyme